MSDPRVLFDAVAGRWYLLAFDINPNAQTNTFHLAISQTSDPTQSWCQFQKDESVVGGVSGVAYGDFPGLGVDDYAFYVTMVRFPFPVGSNMPVDSRVEVFPRASVGCGVGSISPFAWSLTETAPNGYSIWEFQPSLSFGASGFGYLAGANSNMGSYFEVLRISHDATPLLYRNWVSIPFYQSAGTAPQKGTTVNLDFSDARVGTSPVYRNGSLWIAHSVTSASSPYAAVRWYEVKVPTMALGHTGEVWDSTAAWGFPTLMVDSQSNLTLLAAYSGPATYVGANVLTKLSTESNFAPAAAFGASGLASYLGDGTRPVARWGDYFGIALDPDGQRVWVEATYATAAASWATSIGVVRAVAAAPTPTPSQTPIPTPTTPTVQSARSVLISASDAGTLFVQQSETQESIQQQAANITNPAPYSSGLQLLQAWGFNDSWSRLLRSNSGSGVYAINSQATSYTTATGALGDYSLNIASVSGSGLTPTALGATIGDQSQAYTRSYTTPSTSGVPTPVTELYVIFRAGLISSTLDLYAYQGQMDTGLAIRLAQLQATRSTPPGAVTTPTPSPAPTAQCVSSTGPGIPPPQGLLTGIDGYHAAWYGQSGYPTLCQGQRSTATVAFLNTGSLGWVLGAGGQTAFLGTWNPEPGQDQPSPLGGDGTHGSPSTGWPAYNRVAIQPAAYVGPGQVAWFQFTIQAPQTPGTYRLALRSLIEGTTWMEDYGVFWYVTVKAGTTAPTPSPSPSATPLVLTISPASASVGIGGSQQFTIGGLAPGTTVTWSVAGACGAITNTGLFTATALTSPTQPCAVVALASGVVVSAAVTVR